MQVASAMNRCRCETGLKIQWQKQCQLVYAALVNDCLIYFPASFPLPLEITRFFLIVF